MNLVTRSCAAVVAAVLATGGLLVAVPTADAATTPAGAAAGWLAAELGRGGGTMPGFSPGTADVGLTEDVVLALTAGGQGEEPAARTATAGVAAHVADFISYDNLGAGFQGVRLAGPFAKSLLVDEVQGGDPHAFGGWDLEGGLRAMMVTSGASAGRFADKNAFSPDASNGFGQALALLALRRTTDGVPAEATGYLLAQQCPAGGFRLFYDTGTSCASDAEADTDATSLAVEALHAVPQSAAVTAAGAKAVTWLLGLQDPTTGSFSGTGPTASPNSNSSGIAAAALRTVGETAAADKATAYVAGLQLVTGADSGALAYDHDALVAATGGTIDDLSRDQWRRATAQAVLALGLPGYGSIVAVPAPTSGGGGSGGPVVGGTSKATVSLSSLHPGGRVHLTGTGFRPGESVQVWLHSSPVLLGTVKASAAGAVSATVRIPAGAAAGTHLLVALGVASGHRATATLKVVAVDLPAPAASGGGTLPDTGSRTAVPAATGLALLALGGVLVVFARRRGTTPC